MSEELTVKQKAFADFFIQLGNATEAAIQAGYSKKTARAMGCENLTKPNIKKYIDDRMAEKDSAKVAKEDEILQFLTSVLRGETTESIPIVTKDYWEMVDNTPTVKDRTKAAELLGKRYAMWTDKKDLTGNIGVTIVDDLDE